MAAHRYWRLTYTDWNAGWDVGSIAELSLHDNHFVPFDLSGASFSSSGDLASPYAADYAFDGDPETFWASSGTADSGIWIKVDFGGSPKDVRGCAITARNDNWSYQSPKGFILEYSDDNSTWTELLSGGTPYGVEFGTGQRLIFMEDADQTVIYRLRSTDSSQENGGFIALTELVLSTTASGPSVASGGYEVASSSLNPDVYPAKKAFNGLTDDSTTDECWVSYALSAVDAYVGYVFPTPPSPIVEYTIWPRTTYYGQSPKSWVFEKTVDGGATWTTLDTQTGITFAGGVSQSFSTTDTGGDTEVPADGYSAGVLTVSGIATSLKRGVGSSTNNLTITGVASVALSAAGSSSGMLNAAGVGKSTTKSTGSSTNNLSVTGRASVVVSSTGTVSGTTSTVGISKSKASATGSIAAVLVVNGVGTSQVVGASTGYVAGIGIVTGAGKSIASSPGQVVAALTVTGRSNVLKPAVGSSTSSSSVDAVAKALAKGSSNIASTLIVDGIGSYTTAASAVGSSTSTSSVTGVGKSFKKAVGSALLTSTVLGRRTVIVSATGAVATVLSVDGVGTTPVVDDVPPERMFKVPTQDRDFAVQAQNRWFSVKNHDRILTYEDGMAEGTFPERSTFDDLDYGIDFARFLKEGETIASREVEVVTGDTVAYNDGLTGDNDKVIFWLKEGDVIKAEFHYVAIKIVTSAGRKRKITMGIKVEP